jgi:hypothetical protein
MTAKHSFAACATTISPPENFMILTLLTKPFQETKDRLFSRFRPLALLPLTKEPLHESWPLKVNKTTNLNAYTKTLSTLSNLMLIH